MGRRKLTSTGSSPPPGWPPPADGAADRHAGRGGAQQAVPGMNEGGSLAGKVALRAASTSSCRGAGAARVWASDAALGRVRSDDST